MVTITIRARVNAPYKGLHGDDGGSFFQDHRLYITSFDHGSFGGGIYDVLGDGWVVW